MPLGSSPGYDEQLPRIDGEAMARQIQDWFAWHEQGPLGEVRGKIRDAMNDSDMYRIGNFGNRTEDDEGDERVLAGAGV